MMLFLALRNCGQAAIQPSILHQDSIREMCLDCYTDIAQVPQVLGDFFFLLPSHLQAFSRKMIQITWKGLGKIMTQVELHQIYMGHAMTGSRFHLLRWQPFKRLLVVGDARLHRTGACCPIDGQSFWLPFSQLDYRAVRPQPAAVIYHHNLILATIIFSVNAVEQSQVYRSSVNIATMEWMLCPSTCAFYLGHQGN